MLKEENYVKKESNRKEEKKKKEERLIGHLVYVSQIL